MVMIILFYYKRLIVVIFGKTKMYKELKTRWKITIWQILYLSLLLLLSHGEYVLF